MTEVARTAEAGSATQVAEGDRQLPRHRRRYLEHLADRGLVARRLRYRTNGRSEVEHHWLSER